MCDADELEDGEIAEFIVNDVPIALSRVEGTYRAMANTCPHAGGPLGDGELDGTLVACPWHGWGFDVTTGRCELDPELVVPIYDVQVGPSGVWVDLRED